MSRKAMKKSTATLYKERILRVLVFIQKNLDRELCLDDLAKIAHFSPYHFHRIFTGMVGESLKEHVRRLRLERAAMRLKHTDRSVL
ncbi:MAG: helix-turn-helix transcriptional regulator, partial [Sedimentisphaerales bacterium]|nr:helix-turn-helix transcriptional regulator [Sedimentisphaerales bacterium]